MSQVGYFKGQKIRGKRPKIYANAYHILLRKTFIFVRTSFGARSLAILANVKTKSSIIIWYQIPAVGGYFVRLILVIIF